MSETTPHRRWTGQTVVLLIVMLGGLLAEGSAAAPTQEQLDWLEEVSILITEEEREYFLSLEESFRRDAFIQEFWRQRDTYPPTARNEFLEKWSARIELALTQFGRLEDDRARVLLLNGEPTGIVLPNGKVWYRCFDIDQALELWLYSGSERTTETFALVLFRPAFPQGSPYRVWHLDEQLRPDRRHRLPSEEIASYCDDDIMGRAFRLIRRDPTHYRDLVAEILSVPEPRSEEWVETFDAHTTRVSPKAARFELDIDFSFAGRNQRRTGVRGVISVPRESAVSRKIEGSPVHEFLVTGEVVRDDRLFETFRYNFEVPGAAGTEPIPLVFLRYLRPGAVRILIKVEDLLGQRFGVSDRVLEVPDPTDLVSARTAPDSPLFERLAEADAAAERGQTTIRILPPPEDAIQVGPMRISTAWSGEIDHVSFYLDDGPPMTKRRPPYSVEVNLGASAATHRVRVVAFAVDGREVARDEIPVNRGGQRFRVRLIEPRENFRYEKSLGAVAEVEVPDGQTLDRLEIFLDENRVATLYQPPFVQPVLLDRTGLAYLRAVAYLTDGNSTEDVVFINAPDYFEQLEVQFVELYASVVDSRGRHLLGLERSAFRVFEDDVQQEIVRFERVGDLPIHAGLLVDVSASMEEALPAVSEAASAFLTDAILPRDRVTLISFNHRPRVEVKFTNDMEVISAKLAALRAEGSTALFDSLVFALHYFDGTKGPKALLVLSDGRDEASRFDFAGALEVAQRVGVTVFAIGLNEMSRDKASRKLLRRFAAATGGRAFFVDDLSELDAIYRTIQEDLRSRYLLAYQSASDKEGSLLRLIRVEVDEKETEVRTLAGYYPD